MCFRRNGAVVALLLRLLPSVNRVQGKHLSDGFRGLLSEACCINGMSTCSLKAKEVGHGMSVPPVLPTNIPLQGLEWADPCLVTSQDSLCSFQGFVCLFSDGLMPYSSVSGSAAACVVWPREVAAVPWLSSQGLDFPLLKKILSFQQTLHVLLCSIH